MGPLKNSIKLKKAVSTTRQPVDSLGNRRAGAGSPGSNKSPSPDPIVAKLPLSLEGIAEDEENPFMIDLDAELGSHTMSGTV